MKQIFMVISMALIGITTCCCSHPSTQSSEPIHSVEILYATPAGECEIHHYSGRIKASEMLNLGFKVPGEVKSILTTEGATVKEGQLLAVLDDSDYRIGRDAAKGQYEQFSNEIQRIRGLYARKAISQNDYEKAEAGLKQYEAFYQGQQKKVDYARLYAPANGEIVMVNIHENEMVDAGSPVFQFLAKADMEVLIDVPVDERQRIESAQRIVASAKDTTYNMLLLSVSPKADNTQLYQARLRFQNNTQDLTPGMNIGVDIYHAKANREGWVLPISAIHEYEDGYCVWALRADSTVYPVAVSSPIIDANGAAVILSGINADMPIIRAGGDRLKADEKVKVLAPCTKTNIGSLL